MEVLASHHLSAMLQWQPQGPHYLVGLSMGGTIVYEMAQRMLELGIPPALLVFLDTPGPGQMPKTMIEPPHVEPLARHLSMCPRRTEDAAPESPVAERSTEQPVA
ncbi:thioesterase domain-containing protein [Corallococcus interemptor]|uniref:thioesterase domain-containing protein n=1 Tax=Corallococcus interemptor TaxID=2316720 RepID=UPI003D07F1E5